MKIVHGSESLDIPYILHELLNNNVDYIINFFKSMIDTRYLCEYINLSENKIKNICSLYDLLLNVNVITNDEKNLLDDNENKMGPIYNIFIDIHNLSPELISYSIHDVVYLINLYKKLSNIIININKKNYYLICEIVRFTFMERRFFTNIIKYYYF